MRIRYRKLTIVEERELGVCWKNGLRPITAGVYIKLVLIGTSKN